MGPRLCQRNGFNRCRLCWLGGASRVDGMDVASTATVDLLKSVEQPHGAQ